MTKGITTMLSVLIEKEMEFNKTWIVEFFVVLGDFQYPLLKTPKKHCKSLQLESKLNNGFHTFSIISSSSPCCFSWNSIIYNFLSFTTTTELSICWKKKKMMSWFLSWKIFHNKIHLDNVRIRRQIYNLITKLKNS